MKKICDPRKWPRVLRYGAQADLIVRPTPARVGFDSQAWKYSRPIVAGTGEVYCIDPRERVRYMLASDEIQQILGALEQVDWVVELKSLLLAKHGSNSSDQAPPVAKPEEATSEAALQYCLLAAARGERVDYGETLRRIGHERVARYSGLRRVEAEPVEETRGDAWRAVLQEHQHGAV